MACVLRVAGRPGHLTMLPTFLVIGAMKSGTTSLHGYLAAHPQVFMAEPKELHFFSVGNIWQRGQAWYEECFASASDSLARGEASPSYSQADIFRGVAGRIAGMLPDIRIVYIVRHPIERMCSMYLHQLASGREHRAIADAFRDSAYYLNSSRYAWQLDHHLEYIPADRVKVLTTDALRDEPSNDVAELYEFIGVDPAAARHARSTEGDRGEAGRHPAQGQSLTLAGIADSEASGPGPVTGALHTVMTPSGSSRDGRVARRTSRPSSLIGCGQTWSGSARSSAPTSTGGGCSTPRRDPTGGSMRLAVRVSGRLGGDKVACLERGPRDLAHQAVTTVRARRRTSSGAGRRTSRAGTPAA